MDDANDLFEAIEGLKSAALAHDNDRISDICSLLDRFSEPEGALLIAELLGENFPDECTSRFFERTENEVSDSTKELIPHGLEVLARKTQVAILRQEAIQELERLLRHSSEGVRKEATLSLGRIPKTGKT
jgi:hypothetical protein